MTIRRWAYLIGILVICAIGGGIFKIAIDKGSAVVAAKAPEK